MQENNFCGDLFLCGMPWFDLNIFLGCVFQASCWKCLAIPAALAAVCYSVPRRLLVCVL